jgi:hypothetical protein
VRDPQAFYLRQYLFLTVPVAREHQVARERSPRPPTRSSKRGSTKR